MDPFLKAYCSNFAFKTVCSYTRYISVINILKSLPYSQVTTLEFKDFFLGFFKDKVQVPVGSTTQYLAFSVIILVHFYSSYKDFDYLNTGISLTTFCAYPIIQIVLSHILLVTELTNNVIYHLIGCLFGIAIFNRNSFLLIVKIRFCFYCIGSINRRIN